MKLNFLILCVLLHCELDVFSEPYPISPRPLRKLVSECEFIVIGHVQEIKNIKTKDDFGANHKAIVNVIEVLKGGITESQIEIGFNPNFICPAPPRYIENTDVIVFLNKSKKMYFTHALFYGVKTLSLEEIDIYRSRINEKYSKD